jgi:hypothetical protein
VFLVISSLKDPRTQTLNLGGPQAITLGWHLQVVIVCHNASEQFAFGWFAGLDCRIPAKVGDCTGVSIETQIGFSLILVWTMALEAFVREDWADVTIEVNSRLLSHRSWRYHAREQQAAKRG